MPMSQQTSDLFLALVLVLALVLGLAHVLDLVLDLALGLDFDFDLLKHTTMTSEHPRCDHRCEDW